MRAGEPIAVVGIGCRFPGGADSPRAFWELLRAGVDAVGEIPPERFVLEEHFAAKPGTPGKLYTRCGGFLARVREFDAQFFGISPREASRMDPQQRLLLETTWEALEDGGLVPDRLAGSATGVFIGISTHDWGDLLWQAESRGPIDAHTPTGVATSIGANRISHAFDFRGPSHALDTACASALTA